MLRLAGVHAGYGKITVLHGIDLELLPGQILGLLGRNGAGKTTTIRTIMGLTDQVQGTIRLGDVELTGVPAHNIAAYGIAYVPQGRRLFPAMTVSENLRMGLLAAARPDTSQLTRVLDLFPVLKERLNTPAGALSGGQQQMVAMARALCAQPVVLLLDEPAEGLQPSLVERVLETISELRATGVAILLVEQRVETVLQVADDIAFIENGVIRQHATAAQLRDDSAALIRYVGVGRST
jgi:branched-chain amino acid transport system ATP-binding protein